MLCTDQASWLRALDEFVSRLLLCALYWLLASGSLSLSRCSSCSLLSGQNERNWLPDSTGRQLRGRARSSLEGGALLHRGLLELVSLAPLVARAA